MEKHKKNKKIKSQLSCPGVVMQKKVKNKRKQAKRQDRYKWGLAEQATLVLKLAGFKANQYRSA